MMRNIILAGFMGTGKSTVGQIVAERLGMDFIDTDAEVERVSKASIPELFERGEALFRKYEAVVCLQAALRGGQVIAVGGGALLNDDVRQMLSDGGAVICLEASADELMARVAPDGSRPLFGDRAEVEALLARRAEHYAALPYHVNTTGKTPDEVASEVITLWHSLSN